MLLLIATLLGKLIIGQPKAIVARKSHEVETLWLSRLTAFANTLTCYTDIRVPMKRHLPATKPGIQDRM
jgi:hypothetical protein